MCRLVSVFVAGIHLKQVLLGGRVVHSLLQLSERWPCYVWLVDRMKFASLEAKLDGGSRPFSTFFFSISLSLGGVLTRLKYC